jgi:hypothetical protein
MNRARSRTSCRRCATTRTGSSRSACWRPTSALRISLRATNTPACTASTKARRRKSSSQPADLPRRVRPGAGGRRRSAAKDYAGAARARSSSGRIFSSCRPSCCARSSRRCTARTTSATSAWPTSTTRISPRRSAVTPTCWCIARSRPCSPGEALRPANWDDIGLHCSATERRADEATRDVETGSSASS